LFYDCIVPKHKRHTHHCENLKSYVFLIALHFKRYEGLDASLGTSATNYSHLLHHDYAERDANNDRSSVTDPVWYPRPTYLPLFAWGLKRQHLMNKPVPVIECSTAASTSSVSSYGLANTTAPDQGVIQGPDVGSAPASTNSLGQEDGEG
jgi:hypothetical protein